MNTLATILPQRAPSELCFCRNPTVPEHDNVFCSRKCSLADAALSLASHSTHYRDGAEWHDALSPTALTLRFAPLGSGVPSRTRTSSLAPINPRDSILSSSSYSLTSTISQSPEMMAHDDQGLFPQLASLKTEAQLYAEMCRSRASMEVGGHLDTVSSSRTVVEVEEQTVADIFASMQANVREEEGFEWMKSTPVPPRCRRIADNDGPSDDDGSASIWTHSMRGLRRTRQSVSRIRNVRKSISTLFAKRDGSSKPMPSVDTMRVWSPRQEPLSVEHQEPRVANDKIPVKYAVRRSVSFAGWHYLKRN